MTTPITSTTATPTVATPSTSTTSSSSALGKDAFLQLLIAQLKNQDPLQPMDGTQFVTQLAQFSAVEQAAAQSQSLSAISSQLTGIQANDAVGLVGKQVTVRSQQMVFDGSAPATGNVTLAGAASSVTLSIRDANGNTIRTIDMGAKPQGALSLSWDGRDSSGQPVAPGSYSFSVNAKSSTGAAVSVSQDVTGIVSKVTFDQGYAAVVLDSGATAPVSNLISAAAAPPSK